MSFPAPLYHVGTFDREMTYMMRNESASMQKCEYVQMHAVQTADPGLVLMCLMDS
jgi:hypothetical protein